MLSNLAMDRDMEILSPSRKGGHVPCHLFHRNSLSTNAADVGEFEKATVAQRSLAPFLTSGGSSKRAGRGTAFSASPDEPRLMRYVMTQAFRLLFCALSNIEGSFHGPRYEFLVKLGKTFTETYVMLKEVYGNECLSRTPIFEWFKRFKEGRETTEDDPRPGRPSTSKTDENIEKIAKATEVPNQLTEADFQHRFQQWKSRMERCRDREIGNE
ncbi:hypothetical protein NQ318_002121 [Aromia moschata]|uniref:Mos1 transposase HTH domain-containing protein n=1 Tax=Aromia moschata TaxID=1265417 RepID=A0AAV8XZ60_9CUCU|nr:hypothetical protein NQ318_002121 [Aromia moschata]